MSDESEERNAILWGAIQEAFFDGGHETPRPRGYEVYKEMLELVSTDPRGVPECQERILDKIRNAVEEEERGKLLKWHPIETAPTSKRVVVCISTIENHRLVIAFKTRDSGLWLNEQYKPMPYAPTHWIPLPEPPIEHEPTTSIPGRETHKPRTDEKI